MQKPLVSVIIPAFNRENMIGEAIESVLAQETEYIFEIVVSDDGSTDNTGEVAESYGDPVRVLRSQVNQGASAARNAAIDAARGDFIALLDSDDLMLPGRLQTQGKFLLENPEVGVVTASCVTDSDDESNDYFRARGFDFPPGTWLILERPLVQVINHFLGNQSSTTFRRGLILESGHYDVSMRGLEDIDLMMRLARITRFGLLNQPLAIIRSGHGHQLTRSSDRPFWAVDMWAKNMEAARFDSEVVRAALASRYRGAVNYALVWAAFHCRREELQSLVRDHRAILTRRHRAFWLLASSFPAVTTRLARLVLPGPPD